MKPNETEDVREAAAAFLNAAESYGDCQQRVSLAIVRILRSLTRYR